MPDSKALITQLYIGYFDRAPDPEGLAFWIGVLEGGLSLEAIALDFSGQAETQATYDFFDTSGPETPSDPADVEAFITAIYDNLFDRAPDPEGLAFWTAVLQDGYSVGAFILAIIDGASVADQGILDNKIEVACAWSDAATAIEAFALDAAYIADSRAALGEVDGDPASVETGKAAADLFFQDGPSVALSAALTTVAEDLDTSARVKVADIVITDDGVGTNVLALDGADAALFEIDGAELFLKAGAVLDFETAASLDVSVTVDDADFGETPDDTAVLSIAVTDVNDAPSVALENVVSEISENADTTAAVKVADIVISDDALGSNALTLSGAGAAFFEIIGTELFLKAGAVLDFETAAALEVSVDVEDATVGGTPDDSAVLSLAVTDENEAPSVTLNAVVASLSEDLDTGTRIKVADIVISDDGMGSNDLSLGGEDAALFEIDGLEVFLKAGTVLDFAGNAVLDVSVSVDDATLGGTPDDTAALSLAVTDANDAPSVALANTLTVISEDLDTTVAVKVADIVISDDALGSNDLSLSGAGAALFEIVGTELFLKAGAVLDFETAATLEVSVDVDDATVGGTPDDSAVLSLAVSDVNETPVVTLNAVVASVPEDQDTGTRIKVADITVTDDGVGSNDLSLGGEDATLFEIDGTELFLKVGAVLDFESNAALDVSVSVDDAEVGATPDDSAGLSIAVTNVNEAPAVSLENTLTGISEDTDTTVAVKVADIAITDDTLGSNNLTLSGAGAAFFEIVGTELFLKAGSVLDFETTTALEVSVDVDDASIGATPDDSAVLLLAVTDANEAPSVALANALTSVREDLDISPRVKVADIVVSDDGLGTNDLSLSGEDAVLFEIDGSELFLRTGTVLDFESMSSLDVTVAVDDATVGATPDDTVVLSIAVTDVNEIPSISLSATLTTLAEDVSVASRIKAADIIVSDDALGTNILGLTGSDAGFFEIDGTELFLKEGVVLDFETNPFLEVSVTVNDATIGVSPDATTPLLLAVTNVNELPELTVVGAPNSVFEGIDTTSRIQVATITVSDDGTGTNNLALVGADAALFEIDGAGLFLKAGTILDAATNPVLDVSVSVDDVSVGTTPDDNVDISIVVNPGAAGAASDETEELIFIGDTASIVRFGQIEVADADPDTAGDQPGFVFNTDPGDIPYAGVAGNILSLIDTTGHDGLVSFGVIAEVDPVDFTLDNSGSAGDVEACLGTGNDAGVLNTPELDAAGTWSFDNSGATGAMEISLKALDLNAGGALNFLNVDIVVAGNVDLTILGDGLDIDVASTLEVAEGSTLTLTVAQVDALQADGVTVFGEGSVVVTGASDDSDAAIDTDFANLATAVVDLSAVTLAAGDLSDAVEITASGAQDASGMALVDGDGVRVTQTVIGTAGNDAATVGFSASDGDVGTLDVILALGGDDGTIGDPLDTPVGIVDPTELTGDTIDLDLTFADVQINADAGFDAVTGAFGLPDGTVIEVAAGAEFYAGVVVGDFSATAQSSNDGVAVLEALGTMDKTIDVSVAGGSAGWTLIGGAGSTETILIGSAFADTLVDGVADDANNNNEEDIFTGHNGADLFRFNVTATAAATLANVVNTQGVDQETIEITAAETTDDDNESLTFDYAVGNLIGSITIQDGPLLGNIDFASTASIATALATALNNLPGVTASVDGGNPSLVSAVGDNGNRFDIVQSGDSNIAATTTSINDGTDVLQENTITITGSASAGEFYTMTVQLSEGINITAEFLASGGESNIAIAAALVADFNSTAPSTTVNAVAVGDGTITLNDEEDDNGGFMVTVLTATTSVAASSASSLLTGGGNLHRG
jgi:hypothetical protein